jgi:hypothetical protein
MMDEIILSGGLKLYMDTTFEAEWKVCGSGYAKVIPESVKNVNENDEVAISYFIIADRIFPATDGSYFPVTEPNPHYEKYKNAKGNWITKLAFQLPRGGIKWMGMLQDNYMNLIDGAEGTQSQVERWLSQFSFGADDNFTYANLIQIGDKSYWKADDFNIFAKKVGDEIVSISDRVICKPAQIDLTTQYNIQNGAIEAPWTVVGMYTERGEVISGGENLGLKKGDIIGFEPKFCERYTLWNKECFLIKDTHIDVIWEKPETAQLIHI